MTRALLSLVCHVYGAAAVVYWAFLLKQWKPLPLIGRTLVGVGLLFQGITLGLVLRAQAGVPTGIASGLGVVSFLLLGIGWLLELRYDKPVIGAFLTPASLVLLTLALLVPSEVGPLAPSLKGPLLSVHTSVALLGIAAFGVATVVAGMYLLLERQMKGKRFGVWFSRLPSLQLLDELNSNLVIWGFIAISVTLVTGAFFASGTGGLFWQWRPKEVATLGAWAMFAAMLNARFFAGWQGRRAAWVTMAGFAFLVVSFLSTYNMGFGGVR
jgi:ABC-type uncharacterized transport system permease subunit